MPIVRLEFYKKISDREPLFVHELYLENLPVYGGEFNYTQSMFNSMEPEIQEKFAIQFQPGQYCVFDKTDYSFGLVKEIDDGKPAFFNPKDLNIDLQ